MQYVSVRISRIKIVAQQPVRTVTIRSAQFSDRPGGQTDATPYEPETTQMPPGQQWPLLCPRRRRHRRRGRNAFDRRRLRCVNKAERREDDYLERPLKQEG